MKGFYSEEKGKGLGPVRWFGGIKEPATMAGLEAMWWKSSDHAMIATAPPTYITRDCQGKKLTRSPSSSQ